CFDSSVILHYFPTRRSSDLPILRASLAAPGPTANSAKASVRRKPPSPAGQHVVIRLRPPNVAHPQRKLDEYVTTEDEGATEKQTDRKSTRLNSSHQIISYAV